MKFRFAPIAFDAQRERLLRICEAEEVNLQSESVIDKLIRLSDGDLRRSINTL